jgi:putative DNA primase/helicase
MKAMPRDAVAMLQDQYCSGDGGPPTSLSAKPTANGKAKDARKKATAKKIGDFKLVTNPKRGQRAGVHYSETDEDTGHQKLKWVCSPLAVLAKSRDHENREWGRVVEVVDPDGVKHVVTLPATMGPSVGDGAELRRILVSCGLEIASGLKARHRLHDYITMSEPSRKVRCVAKVGWCGDAFVMPEQTYGGAEEIVLQTEGAPPKYTKSGTLDGWRREIAAHAVGNSRLVFSISTSFAGPLLRLAGEESGGVHLTGASSSGKTTTLHVARSPWGVPLGSWRQTDNSAEAMASGACDTLLTLDEIGQAHPRVVGELAYMLGNERGKGRMRRDATLRQTHTWRVLFISTGEVGLAARLLEGGTKVRAGQEVRVLEIPADAGAGMGIFENIHDHEGPAQFAEHLRLEADRNCGHGACEFLAKLTQEEKTSLTASIVKSRTAFIAKHCAADAHGQARRACGRFATIATAGELATKYGITGWSFGDAEEAAARCWHDWLAARGGSGPAEQREAMRQVRLFLEEHGEARFTPVWDEGSAANSRPTINRAGFRKREAGGTTFYVLPEVWRMQVCKGIDAKQTAAAMIDRGWIMPGEDKNQQKKVRIPGEGSSRRVYVVTSAFESADIENQSERVGTPGTANETGDF